MRGTDTFSVLLWQAVMLSVIALLSSAMYREIQRTNKILRGEMYGVESNNKDNELYNIGKKAKHKGN